MAKKNLLILSFLFVVTKTLAFAQQRVDTTSTDTSNTKPADSIAIKRKFLQRVVHYFEESKKDKSQSKFDLSFIGGPSYSVDTKLGLGIIASGLYRIDKKDLSLPPSDVAIYTNITTSGFFAVGIKNTTIFPNNNYRIHYNMGFSYMPTAFFGVGYQAGALGKSTLYDESTLRLDVEALRKVMPNTYIGVLLSATNIRSKNFEDPDLKPDEDIKSTAIGAGFIVSYDTRDFIPNPSKGVFLQYEQSFFPKAFGSDKHFNKIAFTTRAFVPVWEGGLFAFDLNGVFNNGNVPWTMLSKMGGSRSMRGYLYGQYRDRKQLDTQVELRQKIYRRNGIAVWGGAGNVFETIKKIDWSNTLPTYGFGYRWEFKDRVNVRLDYGFGKHQSGFYFNIYEAF